MRYTRAFLLNDLRSIPREPLIVFLLVAPWVYVLALRLVLPVLAGWLMTTYGVAVVDYYPLIMTLYTLPVPLFVGIVYGLLLLDERDDRVFPAIQVTPVSLEAYMTYRVAAAVCVTIPYSALYSWATGLVSPRAVLATLPALALGAVVAVFMMLSLVVFASNKVEGLALVKAVSAPIMFAGIVGFFWQSPWQLLLGIIPSYWPAVAYRLMYRGEPALGYMAAGSLYGVLICGALYRLMLQRIGRTA